MRKQIISTLLAGAVVLTSVAPMASAATTATSITGTGEGFVYSPEDIIDVVVPTDFKIAFNPMQVAIANDNFSGSTQVLSGTYAIQNRSTVPIDLATKFTVTGDTASVKIATAEQVAADNAAATKPTAATFSLDLVTTAAGSTQTIPDPGAKEDTDGDLRVGAGGAIKLAKKSTAPISLTNTTKAAATLDTTLNFALNAGPYTATYDKDADKVVYKAAANAAFDTVAFQFTGTTSTYADLWNAAKVKPSVKATYTLNPSTKAKYNATPLSPTSKAVQVQAADAQVQVTKTAGTVDKKATFTAKPTLTVTTADDGTVSVTPGKNKVSLLALTPGSKADTTILVEDLGTYAVETDADGVESYTYQVDGDYVKNNLELGFYQVTIGKQSFIMNVK